MSEGLDIRLILPFLNHRINEPVFVSFVVFAEMCGAILFVAFALRILVMVRNMHIAECQALKEQKLNKLKESMSQLENEFKEKLQEKKRKREEKEKRKQTEENNGNVEQMMGESSQGVCETEA